MFGIADLRNNRLTPIYGGGGKARYDHHLKGKVYENTGVRPPPERDKSSRFTQKHKELTTTNKPTRGKNRLF
jgi:hypothetical protein